MSTNKGRSLGVYAKNENGGIDELVIDMYNKQYEFTANLFDERDLSCRYDNGIKEFEVELKALKSFYFVVEDLFSGEYYNNDLMSRERKKQLAAERKAKEAQKPVIEKAKVWLALRCELSLEEMSEICSCEVRYEVDDYYDFELMMRMMHEFMHSKKRARYFSSWCIVLSRCMDYMDCKDKELLSVYHDIGWDFDGMSFHAMPSARECREFIADVKHYNHLVLNAKNRSTTDFTTNDVITYVAFAFCVNERVEVSRVCVVDKKRKKINYMYVPDIDYSENINYTFLSEAEFDDLSSRYYHDYKLDTKMDCKYAAKAAKV